VLLQSAIQNPKSRIQNHVSALRRSSLAHGHGQAIGARMTVRPRGGPKKQSSACHVYLYSLCSPDLVAVTFHTSADDRALRPAAEEGDADIVEGISI